MSDDGNNLMDFAVEITKQLIRGGETFQSEILGEWETLSTSAPDYSILSRSIFVHLVETFYYLPIAVKFDNNTHSSRGCP